MPSFTFERTSSGKSTTTTTPVSQPLFQDNLGDSYQKGKTSLDLDEARDDGVLGHQLEHMQTMCTLLQTR